MASAFRNTTVKMFLVCFVCVLGWGVPSAVANEAYSYTGPIYFIYANGCSAPSPCHPIGEGHVSGSFNTDLPPSDLLNLNLFQIPSYDIVSFSFTDNHDLFFDNTNAGGYFVISTNDSGNVIDPAWGFAIRSGDSILGASEEKDYSQTADTYGQSSADPPTSIWTGPTPEHAPVPTPEPSTLFLFGTGLLGLMGVGLRKKRFGYFKNY